PVITDVILSYYNTLSLGKIIHLALRKMHFFSFPVNQEERRGEYSESDVRKYPEALAQLALLQLSKLEKYNSKRKKFVKAYNTSLTTGNKKVFVNNPLLRYPFFVDNKKETLRHF